jgi:DNA-binding transcriptional ArsR family regulator
MKHDDINTATAHRRNADPDIRPRNNAERYAALAKLPDKVIRSIVERCEVDEPDNFPTMFGKLVRELRRGDERADPRAYLDVIKVWHYLNGHRSPRTLRSVLSEYADYWHLLDVPEKSTQYMIDHVRANVNLSPLRNRENVVLDALVSLARLFRKRQYFVSVRVLGECVGVSKSTAARILNRLEDRGCIKRIRRDGPHIYTRKADIVNVGPLYAVGDHARDREQPRKYTPPLPSHPETVASLSSSCVPPVKKRYAPQPNLDDPTRPWWLADWEPWGEGAVEVRVMEDFEMDPEPKPPSKESELFDPVTVRGSWDDESEDGELVGCGRDYAAPAMRDLPVDW